MENELAKGGDTYLKTGNSYLFKVKAIDRKISQSYILTDPFATHHLLPLEDYHQYNFSVNQTIECKIVKINCSGKLFLEPKHPFYIEGRKYLFKVKALRGDISFLNGESGMLLEVLDYFENSILVPTHVNWVGEEIMLVVDKIHKGLPDVYNPDISSNLFFRKNKYYKFTISNIDQQQDKILLMDQYNNPYSISFTEYEHFDFKLGQSILCRVIKTIPFETSLEPQNPFYQIGKTYDFVFKGELKSPPAKSKERKAYYCFDKFGKEALINYQGSSQPEFPEIGQKIKCEVIRFKKGTLVLSY